MWRLKGSDLQLGNFIVDQITQDFLQTAELKFSERLPSELGAPVAHASLVEIRCTKGANHGYGRD
jgi:hypothetical protein